MEIIKNLQTAAVKQVDLAEALEITPQRITQLIKTGVVIRAKGNKGAVLLFESLKNYLARKAENGESVDLREERARHEKIKREITELKLRKLSGSVYDAKTVELAMIEQNVTLRTKLLGIPVKLAPQLEGKNKGEMYAIMTKEIEEALMELSEYKPELFSEEVENNGVDDNE